MKLQRLTKEEKKRIAELSKEKSVKQISEQLGLKYGLVYGFCKRKNLKPPKENRGGLNIKDMTGMKFGALEVISKNTDEKPEYSKTAWWNCFCLCGQTTVANGSDLRQGKTKSCGCRTSVLSRRNWQGFGNIPKRKWQVINQNAIQRNLDFDLDIEYCDELFVKQAKKCYLSGLDISFDDNTASLDRIDSSKGYIKGNVAWCHKDINKLKGQFNNEKFKFLCIRVSDNVKSEYFAQAS